MFLILLVVTNTAAAGYRTDWWVLCGVWCLPPCCDFMCCSFATVVVVQVGGVVVLFCGILLPGSGCAFCSLHTFMHACMGNSLSWMNNSVTSAHLARLAASIIPNPTLPTNQTNHPSHHSILQTNLFQNTVHCFDHGCCVMMTFLACLDMVGRLLWASTLAFLFDC